jgi:hypothetical protein
MRQEKAKPLLESLKTYLTEKEKNTLPQSTLGRAIQYTLSHWEGLMNYLTDGRLEIDNNRAERAVKPFALGRKNWLFSDTVTGVESSAAIYSLIETCKANQIEPYRYLKYALQEMPRINRDNPEEVAALLPFNCKSLLPMRNSTLSCG